MVLSSPNLYRDLVEDWHNRVAQPQKPRPALDVDLYSESGNAKIYLFPRTSNVITNILRNVHTTKHPDTGARPRIQIAIARWTAGTTGISIFVELARLAIRGCEVEVIARVDRLSKKKSDGVTLPIVISLFCLQTLLSWLKVFFGRVGGLKVRFGRVGGFQMDVHSKYMLISARYGDGADWERLVYTGASNFTRSGLFDQDEVMIKVRDKEVLHAFRGNFTTLWSYCSTSFFYP